jgi:hypothetical protein
MAVLLSESKQLDRPNRLMNLAAILVPKHIRFAHTNWKSLRLYLIRKFGDTTGMATFRGARRRRKSIHTLCRFLRRKGIPNVHRFLRPLKLNQKLRDALDAWKTKISPNVRWTRV